MLLCGLFLMLLFCPSPGAVWFILVEWSDRKPQPGGLLMLGLCCALFITGFCLVVWAVRHWRLDAHPDVIALGRFGPPLEVLDAIDAELADKSRVVRLGSARRSFQLDLGAGLRPLEGEVLLTPAWFVYLPDEDKFQLGILRLDRLVWVYRAEAHLLILLYGALPAASLPAAAAVLVDRDGLTVQVPGTEEGVTRLLAEVWHRVPWALQQYDEQTERTWANNREQIVAAVDQRREQIQ
jgi:hypothetical protein